MAKKDAWAKGYQEAQSKYMAELARERRAESPKKPAAPSPAKKD